MAKFSVECDSDADTVCLDSDDERGFQKNMKTYVRRVEDRNGSVEKSHHQKGDVPSDIVNQQERSHHRKINVPTANQQESSYHQNGEVPSANQQERSHHQKANVPSVNPQERSHHQKGDVPSAKQQERSHFRKSNVPPVNRQESPHHENGDATSTIQQERSHHQKGHVQSVNPQERSQHQKGDGTSAIQQARSHHLKTYGPSVKRRASSDHQKVDAQSANQQERSHQQQSNVSSVNQQERSQHQKGDAPSAMQQERSHHQEGRPLPSVPQQESSLPQASDVPVVNQHERAESSGSPKTFLEQLDSDIIYIRGSDSESDDESIIFITESRNQSELRNLPEDFFDRETPPLSPRRILQSEQTQVLPSEESRPTVTLNFTNGEITKRLRAPAVRLQRIDEQLLEEFKVTALTALNGLSLSDSLQPENSKIKQTVSLKEMEKVMKKKKSRVNFKTGVSSLQIPTLEDLLHHQKIDISRENASFDESLLSAEPKRIRITLEVPYSKFLEMEKYKKQMLEKEIAVHVNVNEEKNTSDSQQSTGITPDSIFLMRNKAKVVQKCLLKHSLHSQNILTHKLRSANRSAKQTSTVEKKTDHNRLSRVIGNKLNRADRAKKKKFEKTKRKNKCEFCRTMVPNVADHIVHEHSTLFK